MPTDPQQRPRKSTMANLTSLWKALEKDSARRLELALGLIGWAYILYTYWDGEGLGAKLPTYAGF